MYRESDGLRLKLYMARELEAIMNEISGKDDAKVADINFAFHNSWLIDALRTRGDHIKYQDWAKLNEANRSITQKIHENLDEVTTPKCAFVSIESEEAYNHLSEVDTGKVTIAGVKSKVAEAPEPTNVIWENRDFDKSVRWARLVLVGLAVLFVLFLTFMATVKAKSMTNDLIGKYDDSMNCDEVAHMYDAKTLS
jgi:hypothetical protein